MNYSIIRDMLVNNRCSDENIPASKQAKIILGKIEELEEKIKKFLPKDAGEKLVEDYSFLQGELASEIGCTGFVEGFKIGLLIGAEVFLDCEH